MNCQQKIEEILRFPDLIIDSGYIDSLLEYRSDFYSSWKGLGDESKLLLLKSLFKSGDKKVIEVCVNLFDIEKNEKVGATIISYLGNSRDPKCMSVFKKALKSSDSRVRANSVEALGKLDTETVSQLIVPLLEDEDNRVRSNAVKAVWKHDRIRAESVLRDMIISDDVWKRASGVYVLRFIVDPFFIPYLVDLIEDPFEIVQDKAFTALTNYRDQSIASGIAAFLEKDQRPVYIILKAVRLLGLNIEWGKSLEKLLELCEVDNESIACAALKEMSRSGKQEIIEKLLNKAINKDFSIEIRHCALESLKISGLNMESDLKKADMLQACLKIMSSYDEPDILRRASSEVVRCFSGFIQNIDFASMINEENFSYFNRIIDDMESWWMA